MTLVTSDLHTTFAHRLIYICGGAATTTLNPEPDTTILIHSIPEVMYEL